MSADHTDALPPLPEPFAHICVLPTKDAGPTKFFTAPSDSRGFPVYTAEQVRAVLAAQPGAQVPQGWRIFVTGGDETVILSPPDGPGGITLPTGEDGSLAVRLLRFLARSLLASPQAPAQDGPLRAHLSRARVLMQTFCDRVEVGQVRSVKTYSAFKAFLEETKP